MEQEIRSVSWRLIQGLAPIFLAVFCGVAVFYVVYLVGCSVGLLPDVLATVAGILAALVAYCASWSAFRGGEPLLR